MIKLIGLGLSLDTLPLGSLYKLLKCGKVYVDSYTSLWFPSVEVLEDMLKSFGINVVKACREDLEGNAISKIVDEAKTMDVCIAVAGDPMIATTHSAIVSEALGKEVEVEVQPATSIFSAAVSLSCLQVYRFGKMVTIVKPKNGITYEYPLHVIKANRDLNLHTLALLEIDIEKGYLMTPKEAIEILLEIQRMRGEEVVAGNDKIIVLKSIGSIYSSIEVKQIKEILRENYERALYTLIIPAKTLHPLEEECLRNIGKLKTAKSLDPQTLRLIAKTIASNINQKLI